MMIVKVDEDNFSIKLYRDFVKGKLVGLMEVIPIDELLEVWADHKIENSSEIPNNCEDLQDWKDRKWAEAIVTEPTISKMEQVDKDINVRSKDETQTDCRTCRYAGECDWEPWQECPYAPKDEQSGKE